MSIWTSFRNTITKVAPVAAGFLLGGPAGAAAGGALGSAARGGNIGQILQGAGYGYGAGGLFNAGAAGLASFGGAPAAGMVGPQSGWGGALNGFTGALGAQASGIGKILGAVNLFGSAQQQQALGAQKISAPNAGQGFVPQRPDAISRPQALQDLASYSPEQERSALATRGVNQGLGNDENAYYRNLLQRSLIGEGNKVNVDNPNFLMPIESNYFSHQGHDTSNVMKFLQGIHG